MSGGWSIPNVFACRFCRHDVAEHNVIQGCPHCTCMGTPGEAAPKTQVETDLTIIGPGSFHGTHRARQPEPTRDTTAVAYVAGLYDESRISEGLHPGRDQYDAGFLAGISYVLESLKKQPGFFQR